MKLKTLTRLFAMCLMGLMVNSYAATQEKELLAPDITMSMHNSIINPIEPHLVFDNKEEGEQWLRDMSSRLKPWIKDDFLRNRYLTIIQYEASRAGIDPQLVLSLITIESKFNKYAISNAGARGMMQVMPFWVTQVGNQNQDLFDVRTNVRYGCTILRYYIMREHGDVKRALARYNGSLGQQWYSNKVYDAYNVYWRQAPVVRATTNQSPAGYNYASQ